MTHYIAIDRELLQELWNEACNLPKKIWPTHVKVGNILKDDKKKLVFAFTKDYWECECIPTEEHPYNDIHKRQDISPTHGEYFCMNCGVTQFEAHDARLDEVIDMLMATGYKEGHYEG